MSMDEYLRQVSAAARNAVSQGNWSTVDACARELLGRDDENAEGFFLTGLVAKAVRGIVILG